MNKQDWTYKKLGEVATIVGGSTPKSNIEEYWGGTNYWVTPADLDGNKYQGATPRTITDLAVQKTNLQLLPIGTVLLSSRAPIGKVAITTVPMYCNQGFKNVVCSDLLINEFVYWYLFGKVDYLNSLGRGATFKEISKRATEQIPIPVPPIAEQERIVAELDLLQGIIEKKKEQIKAYDQLAQSIFYSMFGDPIDNPKGWETKTMSDVCASMTKGPFGSDIKKSLFVPKSKDTYKVYIQANAIEKDISLGDYYISKDYFENKMFRFEVKPNDYIITCDGTLGKYIRLPKCIERGIISASLLRLTLNDNINYRYFEHLWDYYILHQQIKDIRNTALKHLPSASKMGKTTIPLPPISLQEEFAEKVEAIERQKALVQQSIEETQTMFDFTMDKYFG